MVISTSVNNFNLTEYFLIDLFAMEHLTNMEGDSTAIQAGKLLYLVERMKAFHGAKVADLQRVPSPLSPLRQGNQHQLFYNTGIKREREEVDQPLDFSAPSKKFYSSTAHPLMMFPRHPDNKHDSLGSDGHSDLSSTHSSSHSPTGSDSPRDPMPGSSSPACPALPNLTIPTPPPTEQITIKSDLLTTVSTYHQSLTIPSPTKTSNAPTFPLLRPITSLQLPEVIQQGPPKPNIQNANLPLNFPFPPVASFMDNSLQRFGPQNPLSLPGLNSSPSTREPINELAKITMSSHHKYNEFRENMLQNITNTKGSKKENIGLDNSLYSSPSTPTHNRSLSSRPPMTSTPTTEEYNIKEGKDEAYWERRRKNNEAAKRSRDSRRAKENEIACRATFLEQENMDLKMELVRLRAELSTIRDQIRN